MKRYFFTAIAMTIATAASMSAAQAADYGTIDLQQQRYEVLNRGGSKSIAKEQVSTPDEISEDATLVDLTQHNRDSRQIGREKCDRAGGTTSVGLCDSSRRGYAIALLQLSP